VRPLDYQRRYWAIVSPVTRISSPQLLPACFMGTRTLSSALDTPLCWTTIAGPLAGSRTLLVNEYEAATVRHMFNRYLELGSVHILHRELEQQGICSNGVTDSGPPSP
jgi:hypothetical protein